MPIYRSTLEEILQSDMKELFEAEKSYGDSWKKRGGIDSFMMLARKWDRIEHQCEKQGFNILEACKMDTRPEGLIDDIKDLRRYLLLVEHEVMQQQKSLKEGEPSKEYVAQDPPGGYLHTGQPGLK